MAVFAGALIVTVGVRGRRATGPRVLVPHHRQPDGGVRRGDGHVQQHAGSRTWSPTWTDHLADTGAGANRLRGSRPGEPPDRDEEPGTTDSPDVPSPINEITVNRYRVSFVRADGRNTPGVDVPYAFDGAATGTVNESGTSLTFVIVRVQAKLEAPLKALVGGGGTRRDLDDCPGHALRA